MNIQDKSFVKALILGIAGSFFFAFTFVLNRSINLSGGYWLWSTSLRYFFTLLIFLPVCFRSMKPVLSDIKTHPVQWLTWSTVGFGLFYAPLTAASIFAESWFTCAAWQFTIVAGVLLTPLFGKRIPRKNLLLSMVILLGIFLMQLTRVTDLGLGSLVMAALCIVIAAFSYPLGNRKMMAACGDKLTTLQRVFGMTLCSMPFWIVCSIFAGIHSGMPGSGQIFQSFLVALFSGVAATLLFFKATDMVKHNPAKLAVIEATQSGEVVFTILLGVVFLHDSFPDTLSLIGIIMIIIGMIANSLATKS